MTSLGGHRPGSDDEPVPTVVRTEPAEPPPHASELTVERVAEVIQTVITGLILAFIFRAFLVEPFIIPTGSMAEALLGAHASRTCPACGWEYNFAPLRTASPTGTGFVRPNQVTCPNCLLTVVPTSEDTVPKAGDRILVHKWPYALGLQPQRWDVIVFRDPVNPEQHYIKRLVGLPGESVEVLDGDVFINGRIARKPDYAQQVLWYIVFDQAYVPDEESPSGQLPRWRPLDAAAGVPGWTGLTTRVLRYDGLDPTPRGLAFNPDTAREYLQDFYAYDRAATGAFVKDVRVTAEVTWRAGAGALRLELSTAGKCFTAAFRPSGEIELRMAPEDQPEGEALIGSCQARPLTADRPVVVELGHLDYRAYVKLDGREVLVTRDSDHAPVIDQLRAPHRGSPAGIALYAKNVQLELRGLRIDRDVYYTHSPYSRRAVAGQPFELGAREYFVLGDNSPDSHDSREWTEGGPHLPRSYRPGTVLADQIVGQAAFVYLPGLLPLDVPGHWVAPDLGHVRFVR